VRPGNRRKCERVELGAAPSGAEAEADPAAGKGAEAQAILTMIMDGWQAARPPSVPSTVRSVTYGRAPGRLRF
jgi:hypothetical protein